MTNGLSNEEAALALEALATIKGESIARALRMGAEALRALTWQPIETAPKDTLYEDGENRYGQYVLVWAGGYDNPIRARWWYRTDSDAANFIADGGWAVFPTRWMPLPAATQLQGESNG
jgi:hypothetical protein